MHRVNEVTVWFDHESNEGDTHAILVEEDVWMGAGFVHACVELNTCL